MNVIELHKFLDQWKKLEPFPTISGWPDKISLPIDVWKKLSEIMSYTKGDGYEYAVNLFFVDGEIVVTPYTRGTRENVSTKDSVQIQYKQRDKDYAEKKIFINSKQIDSQTIPLSKVPKKIEIDYLFNVHTHPIQKEQYSFFSDVDINSFLNSRALVMGLLTDKFWLACKTNNSLKNLGENGRAVLMKISHNIFQGENVDEMIKNNLKNWGLVFYKGEIGESLIKL